MIRNLLRLSAREFTLAAVCLLACVAFSLASPWFATLDNLATVLRNSVELLLIGLGMTLILAMGGVDVSVGVVMGLAAWGVGQLLGANAVGAAAMAGPVIGLLTGAVTATVVVLGRIPAIVGTLGLYGVYRTAIFALLGGQWLSGLPDGLTRWVGGRLLGLPLMAWLIVLAYLLVWLALRRTAYGPHLLAIGHAEEKARLSGIPVTRVRFITFMLSGLLCGLAATFYVATYRNVEMTIGSTLALEAIAAVVLGGTRITGGQCSLLGTVLGVLLLRVLQNGLLLVGVPSLWQTVVTGALLLGVLSAEVLRGRLQLNSLKRGQA
ncbi:ABC transporter permease [Pantoea sp. BAV 3049]|uniref:ABC transporter permease n=1 Tax=Pantoea sp. BAV 3049 TaxID=2654188 RepID=UPI001E403BC2|nr:ABC transporter permease [Pantoea sp. BAV 3049]